ncbi:unnamed protein product [Cuscuta campestris]|uniref:Uncharacterized protein n=1 Tax=Cuscuta campestris TaxID=132261 RepID=A0A484KMG6_9ASTE|nr:unnamed protein product [Cuscuta campestris]
MLLMPSSLATNCWRTILFWLMINLQLQLQVKLANAYLIVAVSLRHLLLLERDKRLEPENFNYSALETF